MPNWNSNIVKIFAAETKVRKYLIVHEDRTLFNMYMLFPEYFPVDDVTGSNSWDYEWACTNRSGPGCLNKNSALISGTDRKSVV